MKKYMTPPAPEHKDQKKKQQRQQQRTGKGFNLPSNKKFTDIYVIQEAIQPTTRKCNTWVNKDITMKAQ